MEKGSRHELFIYDMTDQGKGFGNIDGFGIFVDGAVAGDTVIAEITKVKKRFGFAKTVEIVKESEFRKQSDCIYSSMCGGCVYSEITYEKQLELKEKQVKDKIERIGNISNPKVNSIIGMEDPFCYRNKAELPVRGSDVGFFNAKSHTVTNIQNCLLQKEPAMAAAEAVRNNPNKHIMHLIVRTAERTGQVMAILVCDSEGIGNLENIIYEMDERIYETGYSLESVYINIRDDKDKRHAGDEYICVAGSRTIIEDTGKLRFEISPASFYQVNPIQMEKLYEKAIEYMHLTGTETVLDLYCGVGTIGLYAAEKAGRVIGIESVKEAVIDANRNAVINGIVNARYITGKAEEVLPALIGITTDEKSVNNREKWNSQGIELEKADVAVIDPPRTGCDERLLEALILAEPKRVVYVSCDPATLARDIKVLEDGGYEFIEATPVDMFPWTAHVECVVLMSKK